MSLKNIAKKAIQNTLISNNELLLKINNNDKVFGKIN